MSGGPASSPGFPGMAQACICKQQALETVASVPGRDETTLPELLTLATNMGS